LYIQNEVAQHIIYGQTKSTYDGYILDTILQVS